MTVPSVSKAPKPDSSRTQTRQQEAVPALRGTQLGAPPASRSAPRSERTLSLTDSRGGLAQPQGAQDGGGVGVAQQGAQQSDDLGVVQGLHDLGGLGTLLGV